MNKFEITDELKVIAFLSEYTVNLRNLKKPGDLVIEMEKTASKIVKIFNNK